MSNPKTLPIVKLCASLCGFILCAFAEAQECPQKEATPELLFVNTNENITFHISSTYNISSGKKYGFFLYRVLYEQKEIICKAYLYDRNGQQDMYCFSDYENRASFHLVHTDSNHTDLYLTISGAKRADNGTYVFFKGITGYVCFIVYVYGPPTSEITVAPSEIEEGIGCVVKCSVKSTTVPETHNLPIHVSWYIDDQIVQTGGRFRVNYTSLFIHPVTRDDSTRVITCEAREEGGLTTLTKTTLPIRWGPAPGPTLRPPNTVYLEESGKLLPTINCIADCHPECEFTWIKLSSQSVLSNNGALSFGRLGSDSSGEYMCTATRKGNSTKTSNISIIIVNIQDSAQTHVTTTAPIIKRNYRSVSAEAPQNYTPVAIVGAVLGTALLLAIIFIVYLLRRRHSSETNKQFTAASRPEVPVEMTTQNMNYEELQHDTSTGQNYEALTVDMMNADTVEENRNEMVQPSAEYIEVLPTDNYENADINRKK